LFSAIGIFMLE